MSDGGAADAIFGGGDAGAGGGGGDQSGGDAAGATAAAAAAAEGGGNASGSGGGEGSGGDAQWYNGFGLSDKAEGDRTSDLQWLINKGYKDPKTLVTSMRQLESRVGGALVIPKEGEPQEKFDAYYKAIGRPDKADGYELALPEGASADDALFGSFREEAFKLGLPKAMADGLGKWFVAQQQDQNAAIVAQRNTEAADKIKEWGPQADANKALAQRAATKLGITREDIANIQMGFGAGRTLDLLAKLGGGMAEDSMIDGGARQRYGITAEEAKVELDKMDNDKATRDAILAGDKALKGRRERLIAAIADEEEQKARRA